MEPQRYVPTTQLLLSLMVSLFPSGIPLDRMRGLRKNSSMPIMDRLLTARGGGAQRRGGAAHRAFFRSALADGGGRPHRQARQLLMAGSTIVFKYLESGERPQTS